jgi:hypothetical protein
LGIWVDAGADQRHCLLGIDGMGDWAVRSTRRQGLALKLTMLSENSLLLPMVVRTLSGWSMVVANRPIS